MRHKAGMGMRKPESVEVLLDTPPGSPKNCPEAKEGSVRVQITPSRPVSFFMVKPRFYPSRDQSSQVQSSHPMGFGQVLSDQPAVSRLKYCELGIFGHMGRSPGCDVDTTSPMPYRLDYEYWFPLLEARLWQEAKPNLLTVALDKDDRIAWCWTLGPPV
ncbi:hypothetical protein F2Q70_00023139 [Brassica cretica]|uniref:Uncharacterized protein n=1 Tax=Brassica cretica TaxID=69181 RepID=A0A8S9GHY0_BRACR|nr:hypothetical protein F2Q70_00023139 [Brassica cretica]